MAQWINHHCRLSRPTNGKPDKTRWKQHDTHEYAGTI